MKKIFSLILVVIMFISIIPTSFAISTSELTMINQSFAGLTDTPENWTIKGTQDVHYRFNSDSIGTAALRNSYVKAYYNELVNTENTAYKVTFSIAHYSSGSSYIHIGTNDSGSAISDSASSSGYSIRFYTKDYKKAVIEIYKNGKNIGTMTDKGINYAYQKLRQFEFSVTKDSIILSGAGNMLAIEDTEPIYSGYIGFVLKDSNNGGKSKLSLIKLNKILDVSETNINGPHGLSDDIEISFTYPLSSYTVNKNNVYITDESGNEIDTSAYSVKYSSGKIIIGFNKNLEYETNYNVILGTGIYISGTSIGLASETKLPFTTAGLPFSAECFADEKSLTVRIKNTLYESQKLKVFVKATDDSGISENYVFSVDMPEIGETVEILQDTGADLSKAVLKLYVVTENNTPFLNAFSGLDSENNTTSAGLFANELTEDAKDLVKSIMSEGEYSDIDTLYTDFTKAVITAGINGKISDGYNHITDLFAKNGEFVGLNLDEYNKAINKALMNEYIYNYGVTGFEDVQKAIDEAYVETEQKKYTHTFSTDDTVQTDWDFYVNGVSDSTLSENSAGVTLSDEKGFVSTASAVPAQMFSKFNATGNYEISGIFSRPSRDLIFYFDYIDSNNYCYVKFTYSSSTRQKISVSRVSSNVTTTFKTVYDKNLLDRKVLVEADGYVTVKDASDEIILERTYIKPFAGGKAGFGLNGTAGYIKTVNIRFFDIYKCTFLNEDGSVFYESHIEEGTVIEAPYDNPEKAGLYTFKGWEGFALEMTADKDVSFKAKFEYTPYELYIFDEDDNKVAYTRIGKDSTLDYSIIPEVEEHTYKLYTDKELTTEFDQNSLLNEDTTLYIKYIYKQYKYTFLNDDGSVFYEETVDYGSEITQPETEPEKSPYHVFDYWDGFEEGMTISENISFIPVFKYKAFTITVADTGEIEEDLFYGDTFYIEPDTKENYTFLGYYTGENGTGTKVTDEEGNSLEPFDFTDDLTVYSAFEYTNKALISGSDSLTVGQEDVEYSVLIRTDKDIQYVIMYVKYPNELEIKNVINKDFAAVTLDKITTYSDCSVAEFTGIYSYNGLNAPKNTIINPFDIKFNVSDEAVTDKITVELLSESVMIGEAVYAFDALSAADITINAKPSEYMVINGASDVDKKTQYSAVTQSGEPIDVTWSVNDTSIAVISEDGVLTPVKNGTVIITAANEKMYVSKTVEVKAYAVISSLISDTGLWDKDFNPYIYEYTVTVGTYETAISLTPSWISGTLKYNGSLIIPNRAKSISLKDDVDVITLSRQNASGCTDCSYVINIVRSPAIPTISSGEVSDNSFIVKMSANEYSGTLWAALYDENGSLIQIKKYTPEKSLDVTFDSTGAYAKVMWWNENMIPVCDSKIVLFD